MTLLEILVRDWPKWIDGSRTYQDEDGDLIASEGYCFRDVVGNAEIAIDPTTAIVTELRWREAQAIQRAQAQKCQALRR